MDSLRDRTDTLKQWRTLPDVADLVQLRRILYEIELTILNNGGHFLTYLRTWYNCSGFFTRVERTILNKWRTLPGVLADLAILAILLRILYEIERTILPWRTQRMTECGQTATKILYSFSIMKDNNSGQLYFSCFIRHFVLEIHNLRTSYARMCDIFKGFQL